MSDYVSVDCEVAREALSARLDGEREPVPSARVDEHLADCAQCRAWFDVADRQALHLRRLVQSRPMIASFGPIDASSMRPPGRPRMWPRWALLVVGFAQVGLAIVQGLNVSVGLAQSHHGFSGHHLLNESTSWSLALGVVMVVAAVRPRAALGLASVLAVFSCVLTIFVVVDAFSGGVTLLRVMTHLPAALGALLAFLVWRGSSDFDPNPDGIEDETDIVLPPNASRGRRRGHLWPTDGSAA